MGMKRVKKDGKVKKVNVNTSVKTGKTYWTNDSVRMIKEVDCYIPKSISNVMLAIDRKYPIVEFSIFCKADYNTNQRTLEVDEAYFVPTQEVSGAGVDYKEDAPEGFDVVIHKHPRGCRSFSGTDDTYINQNFDHSILWEGGDFVKGQTRVKTPYGFVKLELVIHVESDDLPIIPDDLLKKIKPTIYSRYQGNKYGGQGIYEDYHDYMNGHNTGQSQMFGGRKNNQSIPVWRDKTKPPVWGGCKSPHQQTDKNFKGAFLTDEQEEVNNFVNQQEEDLIDYLEEVQEIMTANPGMSWQEAEEAYKVLNADELSSSTLDFTKPDYGIVSPGSSDQTNDCKGSCNCDSHVQKIVDMGNKSPEDLRKLELLNIMKEKKCGLETAKSIYAVRHANDK